jgi:hypothetical protein
MGAAHVQGFVGCCRIWFWWLEICCRGPGFRKPYLGLPDFRGFTHKIVDWGWDLGSCDANRRASTSASSHSLCESMPAAVRERVVEMGPGEGRGDSGGHPFHLSPLHLVSPDASKLDIACMNKCLSAALPACAPDAVGASAGCVCAKGT